MDGLVHGAMWIVAGAVCLFLLVVLVVVVSVFLRSCGVDDQYD